MRARPSMISSLFAANEGPTKFVLLPFRQLLGDLGASWTNEQDAHAVLFINRPYATIKDMAPADGGDSMMAWQEACQKWKRRAEVVQLTSSQKSGLGDRLRPPSGFGFPHSKLTVIRRTALALS
jgi:hypothetical protein